MYFTPSWNTKQNHFSFQQFCDHCHQKISYLSDVSTQTRQEISDAAIQCEFTQLQDQWKEIAKTIQGWIEQLQLVITQWEDICIRQEGLLKWLEVTEKHVKTIVSTDTVNIQKLEELKSKLRVSNKLFKAKLDIS